MALLTTCWCRYICGIRVPCVYTMGDS